MRWSERGAWALYRLASYLALPLAFTHLLWRARKQPAYLHHWSQRLGLAMPPAARPTGVPLIWLHCVSLGETRAATALIAALRQRYPGYRLLLTHTTPTGWAAGETLWGDALARAWLPYDTPGAVARFLDHWRPSLGLLMETELWPNLTLACVRRQIPLALINGRLSEKSARAYRRFAVLTRLTLRHLALVLAQAEADAARLRSLGAREVVVTGNLKFDLAVPAEQIALGDDFRQGIGARPVILCASTRQGEEVLLLDAWQCIARAQRGSAMLAIVPRHPERFDEVAALAAARGLTVERRSQAGAPSAACQLWLGDSLGEMFAYYQAADVVLMGGSLLDYGCQNLIEACALGKPVLLGPSTYNFAAAASAALEAGAALQAADAETLLRQALALTADSVRRKAMGEQARAFASQHCGAVARTLEALAGMLNCCTSTQRKEITK